MRTRADGEARAPCSVIPGNVAAFRPAPADIAALKRFARSRSGRAFQALFDAYIPSADSPLAALDDVDGTAGLPPLPPHMPDTPAGLLAGALGVAEEALPVATGALEDDAERIAAPVERPCCAEAELPVFFIPGLKLVLPVQARPFLRFWALTPQMPGRRLRLHGKASGDC